MKQGSLSWLALSLLHNFKERTEMVMSGESLSFLDFP